MERICVIMAKIRCENIKKIYKSKSKSAQVLAVNDVSLMCKDGEFLVLLGPSGCGKTSTLRMIAGLEEIDDGKIYIGDELCNDLSPKERNVAMAFENYALYPPLTVAENLIFPLKARGVPKAEINENLRRVVEMLKIEDILDRRPGELSGGQQQRISLGRCIIRDSNVYLMDEPLSHLDSELRLHMRGELKRIHEFGNLTIIYVTHDQIEALALADRIAVMDNGRLQQIGTPEQIYEHPANIFVAGFIGEPSMNFIQGELDFENGSVLFKTSEKNFPFHLPHTFHRFLDHYRHKKLVLGIRPQYLHLIKNDGELQYHAVVVMYESLGEEGVLEVSFNDDFDLLVLTEPDLKMTPGSEVAISIDWQHANLFDPDNGLSLTNK